MILVLRALKDASTFAIGTFSRQLRHYSPMRPSVSLCDSGLDGGGDFYDQGHLWSGAKVQGGAHLLSKHHFCGFYRLGGAVGGGLHGVPLGRHPARANDPECRQMILSS